MKKKQIWILGVVIILVSLLLVAFMGQGLETEVVTLSPHLVTDTFTEDGLVTQGEATELISEVSGKVTQLLAASNQYVSAGDVIAQIDTKDYDYEVQIHESNIQAYTAQIEETLHTEANDKEDMSYSIAQLKENLKSLEAGKKHSDIQQVVSDSPEEYVNLLSLNLEVSQNNYDLSVKALEQMQALYEIGAASENDITLSQNKCNTAKAELTKAQTQYAASHDQLDKLKSMGISSEELNTAFYASQDETLDANIESLNAQIAAFEYKLSQDYSTDTINRFNALIEAEKVAISQLQEQIASCSITAPIEGYITALPIENLSQIAAGTSVATIKPTHQLTISCDVLTTCEPYLQVGDSVLLTQRLKSEDVTYTGKITEIFSFAKEATSALGLKEYRVEVTITPDDTTLALKDGFEVEVTFTTYSQENVLSVPNSALFEIEDMDYVYKLENKVATLTPVEIAHKTNTESVIISGLAEGDEVIYNANTEGLVAGTHIKPIKK